MLELILSVGLGAAITWFLTHLYYKKQIQNSHELNSRLFEDYKELKTYMIRLNSKLKELSGVSSKQMSTEKLKERIEIFSIELANKIEEEKKRIEGIRKINQGICPLCGTKSLYTGGCGAGGYDLICGNCGVVLGDVSYPDPPFYR